MNVSEQLRRIGEMEEILDRAEADLRDLVPALEKFCRDYPDIQKLISYYESDAWREDYDADERGIFLPDFKRHVISQDGVYDMLTELHDALELMQTFNTEA